MEQARNSLSDALWAAYEDEFVDFCIEQTEQNTPRRPPDASDLPF
jgi:hypothetical protein